jgi:hypothetical protein
MFFIFSFVYHFVISSSSIKKEDLEKLFPSFKKAGNKHKRINAAVDSILKNT